MINFKLAAHSQRPNLSTYDFSQQTCIYIYKSPGIYYFDQRFVIVQAWYLKEVRVKVHYIRSFSKSLVLVEPILRKNIAD